MLDKFLMMSFQNFILYLYYIYLSSLVCVMFDKFLMMTFHNFIINSIFIIDPSPHSDTIYLGRLIQRKEKVYNCLYITGHK